MSNTHYENAVAWIDDFDGEDTIPAYWLQKALVEATLALASEARTANLLAYMQPVETAEGQTVKINGDAAVTIFQELNVRLGRLTVGVPE